MNFFDFSEIEKSESSIKKTWGEYREALAEKRFSFDDVDAAKKEVFLKTYNDLFHDHNGIELQTKTLRSILGVPLGRGARLKEKEIPDHERFLPQKEFINEDNRFSPAGVEWLYLAVGGGNIRSECAKKECRMKTGERFGFCDFQLSDNVLDQKIVDLTIADALSYADINNELEQHGQKQYKRSFKIAKATGVNVPINRSAFKKAMTKWSVFTYSKLLSQQIFIPLGEGVDKAIEYAPFQSLAQYFISLGYAGIMYGSTVYPQGKNLVLFDKNMATPIGDIDIFIIV